MLSVANGTLIPRLFCIHHFGYVQSHLNLLSNEMVIDEYPFQTAGNDLQISRKRVNFTCYIR